MRVLICGLPGAGKTTLASKLKEHLNFTWLNADEIRTRFNDWDFSPEGRLRQAQRMFDLSNQDGLFIADFVAPTKETRELFKADLTIWMDTITAGRFEDTNRVFEEPMYDLRITGFTPELGYDIDNIISLINSNVPTKFDYKKPTTQMLGRWQPWHEGHQELFKRAYAETGQVYIMIRDVGGIIGQDAGAGRTASQNDNPFDFETVCSNIETGLLKDGFKRGYHYEIALVPNIVDISYGRGVGYTFTQHDLGETLHNISATKIRAKMREEGKL